MPQRWRNRLRVWLGVVCDPRKLPAPALLPRFFRQWFAYRRLSDERAAAVDLYPCVLDAAANTPFDNAVTLDYGCGLFEFVRILGATRG
ncbi:MAG TPA: hypothetical protein VJ001_17365 [Rhodocyclaceae bacterium]|nr:hypothetical protein [Rhodocyclaceae bacterium]